MVNSAPGTSCRRNAWTAGAAAANTSGSADGLVAVANAPTTPAQTHFSRTISSRLPATSARPTHSEYKSPHAMAIPGKTMNSTAALQATSSPASAAASRHTTSVAMAPATMETKSAAPTGERPKVTTRRMSSGKTGRKPAALKVSWPPAVGAIAGSPCVAMRRYQFESQE